MINISTIANLVVSLTANTSGFQKDMQGAQKRMQDMGKRVGDTGKKMSMWVTGPIVGAGAAALGLAKKWSSTGDEIAKSAMKMGVSTDALQELRHVADQVGVETSSMDRALGRLNQRMGRAAEGNDKYAEALQAVGVSYEDVVAGAVTTEEAFMQSIETLHQMEDSQKQSALASELFGTKLSRDLLPAIQAGGDEMEALRDRAQELGIVMDEDAIKAAEDFEDAWDETQKMLMGVVHTMGAELLPIFTEQLVPAFQEHVIPLIQRLGDFIGNLIKWFTDLSPTTQKYIGIAVALAAALGPVLMLVGKLIVVFGAILSPIGLVVVAIAGLIAIFGYLWKTNEDFRDAVLAIWEKIKEVGISIWELLKESVSGIVESLMLTVTHILEVLQQFWDDWGETILAVAMRIWDQIKLVIETAINLVAGIINFVLAVIRGDWEGAWDAIKSTGETIWNLIKGTVENVFGAIRDVLAGIWDNIGDKFSSAWDGFVAIVKGAANSIIGIINTIIGAVEGMVNAVGSGVNYLPSFDIPDWVPGIGGRSFGLPEIPTVSLPKIPTMDAGGLVQGPGLFHVGPGVKEIVREPGGKQTANITIYLDGQVIARAIGEPLGDEIRVRTGMA